MLEGSAEFLNHPNVIPKSFEHTQDRDGIGAINHGQV